MILNKIILQILSYKMDFQFIDERDASGFLVASYLCQNRNFINRDQTIKPISILNNYPELFNRASTLFQQLGDNVGQFGLTESSLLNQFLESSNSTGPRFLDYGYLRPYVLYTYVGIDIDYEGTGTPYIRVSEELINSAVTLMLNMGLNPNLRDRWDNPLHSIIYLDGSQWRTLMLVYHYPLCEEYTLQIGGREFVRPLALSTLLRGLLGTIRLSLLIVNTEEFITILHREPRCTESIDSWIEQITDIQNQMTNRNLNVAYPVNYQQLEIFLTAFQTIRHRTTQRLEEDRLTRESYEALLGSIYGLPTTPSLSLTPFDQFENMLPSIDRYELDPRLQVWANAPNKVLTVIDKNNNEYLVKVRYEEGKLYAPL